MSIEMAVLLWVVGALAGSMVFFAATVAPTVFGALPADQAGSFLRAFFPKYYLWGLVVALLASIVAMGTTPLLGALCALVAVLFGYARQVLMPRINRARDAALIGEAGAERRFQTLHLQSVLINGLQLLLLIAVAGRLAWQGGA